MIKEFVNDDAGYIEWLESNSQNGYVLNSYKNTSAKYLPLHHATCVKLKDNNGSNSLNPFTGEGYKKLCFQSSQDIYDWMHHNYPYSKRCSYCNPKIYFSDGEYQDDLNAEVLKSLENPTDRKKQLKLANKIPKKHVIQTTGFDRSPHVIAERLEMANGICEDCNKPAPFMSRKYNRPFLEVHHVKFLSEGGDDSVENTVALCPNCHRKRHHG